MIRRYPQFSLLAFLFALITTGSSALPAPVLWECHHAARIVTAAATAEPGAMPCRMAGMLKSEAGMVCCLPATRQSHKYRTHHNTLLKSSVTHPDCNPTYVPLLAAVTQVSTGQYPSIRFAMNAFGPGLLSAAAESSSPPTASLRQRPPPGNSCHSADTLRPRLRAPPIA